MPRAPFAVPFLLALAAILSGCVASPPEDTMAPATAASSSAARVVIAHVDTGINPYHAAFRDESPLAYAHPSTYLPGYPADAPALNLSLHEVDIETAFAKDEAVWASVESGVMYWIPGTRIVGAISMGQGGTNCPYVDHPPANLLGADCEDRPILDDHGHGTMTASRMAAAEHSLAPTARIVSVEGFGGDSVRWLADQGWIDVQTNSWLGFVPPPVDGYTTQIGDAFAYAAERMVTLAASGNGAAYLMGFAPTPTYLLDTAAPGVILVGAHDNGFVTPWSGAPPHVIADGFGGWRADHDTLDGMRPDGVACCTSAASPYAAGGAAAIVLEARRILGDPLTGAREGVLAQGPAGLVEDGPLADGDLTLSELRAVLTRTATPRPTEGPDDGVAHWMGTGAMPEPTDLPQNPYCVGCWTAPVKYSQLPDGPFLVAHAGYGAVDPGSVELAKSALRAETPLPERAVEDAFFAADQTVRGALFPS